MVKDLHPTSPSVLCVGVDGAVNVILQVATRGAAVAVPLSHRQGYIPVLFLFGFVHKLYGTPRNHNRQNSQGSNGKRALQL